MTLILSITSELCTDIYSFFKSAFTNCHPSQQFQKSISWRATICFSSFTLYSSLWQNILYWHLFHCCCPLCTLLILCIFSAVTSFSVPLSCFYVFLSLLKFKQWKHVKVWQQILRRAPIKNKNVGFPLLCPAFSLQSWSPTWAQLTNTILTSWCFASNHTYQILYVRIIEKKEAKNGTKLNHDIMLGTAELKQMSSAG